uniref:transposase n=1 Tax=Candidatus Nitrotoga sp. 1052 TaxID=2886964 RepID=UPI00211215DE|nr:transposase [Candidatus Nitrotoga sp. 1052]
MHYCLDGGVHCTTVTSRGNARNSVFLDDEDQELFFVCLGKVVVRFGWLCHAYCLMDNHYHLLIETTPEGNLSLGMRQLNGFYTSASTVVTVEYMCMSHVFTPLYNASYVEASTCIRGNPEHELNAVESRIGN